MALQQELEKSGSWLFRYRSFVPLLVFPMCVIYLFSSSGLIQAWHSNAIWQWTCLTLSLAGLAIRIATVGYAPEGTSGRNTKYQVAETLTTTGMYSVVRNPLYVGNYFVLLGFLGNFQSLWLVLFMTCLYFLFYERIIMAEEAFLRERFGKTFEQWAERTPGFIPKFSLWTPPSYSFSWPTVFAREYNAFFVITTSFSITDLVFESMAAGKLSMDPFWMGSLIAGVLVFTLLRILKRRILVLKVARR
jgi:protein-S-isoprenylcysteine O-methyltransferase Ste14